jgi:hypothetical protein
MTEVRPAFRCEHCGALRPFGNHYGAEEKRPMLHCAKEKRLVRHMYVGMRPFSIAARPLPGDHLKVEFAPA